MCGERRVRLPRLRPRSAMIRLPMLNVDSWFDGVRIAMNGRHRVRLRTRCCCTRARKVYSAQLIARRDSQRDRISLSESGCCRNDALERHSEALHIGRCGGVPCGTSEMFRTYASSRVLSTAIETSTIAYLPAQSGAQAGSTPAGRAGRTVGAQRRALTPPSTA